MILRNLDVIVASCTHSSPRLNARHNAPVFSKGEDWPLCLVDIDFESHEFPTDTFVNELLLESYLARLSRKEALQDKHAVFIKSCRWLNGRLEVIKYREIKPRLKKCAESFIELLSR